MFETSYRAASSMPSATLRPDRFEAKPIYFSLLREVQGRPGEVTERALGASGSFLADRLATASLLPCDLPDDLSSWPAWLDETNRSSGLAFRAYLATRRDGAPRRYFRSASHALQMLKAVAPTKLVDGAWLYGLLRHWRDPRLAPLIRIYLEELGNGRAAQNHVVIYRQLLARHGCDAWGDLPDEYFTQGAIQLSLAHHAEDFLPEVIGFNLGYEQLPLHLLITSYELSELGIDPTYFRLHVTVDNATTGHARKALEGMQDMIPRLGDAAAFQRRVVAGYKLNLLGIGTCDAVDAFDLERELLGVLQLKAGAGAQMHCDRCRVGGKTVNEWLASPGGVAPFLAKLEQMGWIRRGQAPMQSRFWQLIDGDQAPMFGVFSAYERQLLHDWIAGEDAGRRPEARVRPGPRGAEAATDDAEGDFGVDVRMLRQRLDDAADDDSTMRLLAAAMSPASHHSPVGLLATRLYCERFDRRS